MERDDTENPELDEIIEEATAEGEPGRTVARRELEHLANDEQPSPQDGLQM